MRTPRKQSPAEIYHVVSRGTGRQLIFENDDDRLFFLRLMRNGLEDSCCEIYAWCLMGNHFHLLLHAPLEKVSLFMKYLVGTYAQWFNQKAGRVGHLFQDRFKSEPIDSDEYLLTVVRYIHDNPAKAGLARADSYRWSSYGEYLGNKGVCATKLPLEAFGGVERFIDFHKGSSNAKCLDVDGLRSATRAMPDELAIAIAEEVLGDIALTDLKTLGIDERRKLLRMLKSKGLSIRQIERLTGIGRTAIAKA